jgi:hypothetical protein
MDYKFRADVPLEKINTEDTFEIKGLVRDVKSQNLMKGVDVTLKVLDPKTGNDLSTLTTAAGVFALSGKIPKGSIYLVQVSLRTPDFKESTNLMRLTPESKYKIEMGEVKMQREEVAVEVTGSVIDSETNLVIPEASVILQLVEPEYQLPISFVSDERGRFLMKVAGLQGITYKVQMNISKNKYIMERGTFEISPAKNYK